MTGKDENALLRRGPNGWQIGVDLPQGSTVTVEPLPGTQQTRIRVTIPVGLGRAAWDILLALVRKGLWLGLRRRN